MPVRPSPTVRGRRLRYELRRLREERGLTIEQVVAQADGDFSSSAISRWEKGDRRVRPTELRVLLDIYDVDADQREVLLTLAREARQRGWWHSYGSAIPSWFQFFVGLEAEASSIRAYEAELMPGLLQTPDYYREFLRTAPAADSEEEIERKIAVRTARQERLTGDNPLTFWAVVNEAVIRRVVGGPEVMRDQLRHVAELARLPHVSVQVLPFRAGAHPAMEGSFTILSFPEASDPDIIYLENQTGGLYLEETPEIERYTLMFNHLIAKALDPDESRAMIARVAEDLS
ncbi:Helix-turn-helix domain-containing protein [Thermomonospora echinospora]|uniref:Helix-turn-helix domain-containing protein n=1 Tax=Thermomonospora echinospora TaxID=1992 RepID=A0A1H6E2N3_9ACTN|nr:helix-turn-helix transcriptional regulator [Thermomonospora echinospora]SEG91165.1 Helix-turn-helix domain-containing protein [Thermomonospora echinospora]